MKRNHTLLALVTVGLLGSLQAAENRVSGKVLLGGKPVGGQVIFVGPDGKELPPAPLTADGRYFLDAPPPGKYKIAIRPLTEKVDKPKVPVLPKAPKPGVAPPAKFAKVTTSGLTCDVKEGTQVFDIVLKP